MSDRISALVDERADLDLASRKIMDGASGESRDMNAEETQEWDKMDARIDAIGGEINRREKQAKREVMLDTPIDTSLRAADPTEVMNVAGAPLAVTFGSECRLAGSRQEASFDAGSRHYAIGQDTYRSAWSDYIRDGAPRADLQVGKDDKGGVLVPTQMMAQLLQTLDDAVSMRSLATINTLTNAVSMGVPTIETDPADADWTAEVPASDLTEDTSMAFGKRELMPHLVTKLVKVSEKLLRTSVIDVEGTVSARVAHKFAITEEKAFLTGDGAQQPLGVYTPDTAGISTTRDITAASTTAITADEMMDCFYSLKSGYQAGATWLLHRITVKNIRKLKDGQGQYLWNPGLNGGTQDTILGSPIVQSENAPSTFTGGLYVVLVGDFSYYWIVDALTMTIQRLNELFALTNEVGFVARKETDGMPIFEEAFARIILNT